MTVDTAHQQRGGLQLPQVVIRLQLPLSLRLILAFLLTGMVGNMTLSHLRQPPSSPFAIYDDLVSGDVDDPMFWSNHETLTHAAFELACTTRLASNYCQYQPKKGPVATFSLMGLKVDITNRVYSLVRVENSYGGDYHASLAGGSGIYFAMNADALTIGDVAVLWGRPTIEQRGNWLFLRWPEQGMSTLVWSKNGWFNYRSFLNYLFLEIA